MRSVETLKDQCDAFISGLRECQKTQACHILRLGNLSQQEIAMDFSYRVECAAIQIVTGALVKIVEIQRTRCVGLSEELENYSREKNEEEELASTE